MTFIQAYTIIKEPSYLLHSSEFELSISFFQCIKFQILVVDILTQFLIFNNPILSSINKKKTQEGGSDSFIT